MPDQNTQNATGPARESGSYWVVPDGQNPEVWLWDASAARWWAPGSSTPLSDAAHYKVLGERLTPPAAG